MSFTITDVRIFDGSRVTGHTAVRVAGGRIDAPGGHPTMAYSPFPYVAGPQDGPGFVADRLAEGATHPKVLYGDGSAGPVPIPSLNLATVRVLVRAARVPVIATLDVADGFPDPRGDMPLLAQPEISDWHPPPTRTARGHATDGDRRSIGRARSMADACDEQEAP